MADGNIITHDDSLDEIHDQNEEKVGLGEQREGFKGVMDPCGGFGDATLKKMGDL